MPSFVFLSAELLFPKRLAFGLHANAVFMSLQRQGKNKLTNKNKDVKIIITKLYICVFAKNPAFVKPSMFMHLDNVLSVYLANSTQTNEYII